MKKFAFNDLELFETQLEQLTKILTHLIPSTSYLRNTLVKITGSFKAIWVPKGEDEKKGKHLSVVAKIVRAPKAQVLEYLLQKEKRLREKLNDKYFETWENIESISYELIKYGKDGSEKKNGAGTLLALEISTVVKLNC